MQLDYYLKQLNELFLVYYLLVCINMGEQSFLYPYAEAKGMPNELFSYLDDIFQSLDPTLIHPGDEVYIISCTMLFGSFVFHLAILLLYDMALPQIYLIHQLHLIMFLKYIDHPLYSYSLFILFT